MYSVGPPPSADVSGRFRLPRSTTIESEGDSASFSLAEIDAALKALPSGKAPGPDGLPVDFYRAYWRVLGVPLARVLNSSLQSQLLPSSMRCGIVTLLCKDESRRLDLGSYRPISLLNTDYKILAKAALGCLCPALETIVHPSQVATVPGRSILRHCQALRDSIYWAHSRQLPAVVASFDQAKAFDRVDHGYLFSVMRSSGIPENLCRTIETMYRGASSRVVVNGMLTDPFNVSRGVRQGCPLSPALYALAFNPLLVNMVAEPYIHLLSLPGQAAPPVFAYADDLTVIVRDEDSLGQILVLFDLYGSLSGAEINREKSAALFINFVPSCTCPFGVPVRPEIKILGIIYNDRGVSAASWTRIYRAAADVVHQVEFTDLPILCRARLLNSWVYSKFWYLAYVAEPPRVLRTAITRIAFRCIWGGSVEWVSRRRLCLSRDEGGLAVPDFRVRCTALFLKATFDGMDATSHPSSTLLAFWLGPSVRHFTRFVHTVPHSEVVAPYLRGAVTALRCLLSGAALDDIRLLSTQLLYDALHRAELSTSRVAVPPIPRGIAWRRMTAGWLDARRASLQWRLAHDVLPLRARLHRFGIATPQCPFCGQVETAMHAFLRCDLPELLLERVRRCFSVPPFTWDSVRFLDPLPVVGSARKLLTVVLVECNYQIWLARCQAVHCGDQRSFAEVLVRVRRGICSLLVREHMLWGQREFARRWICPSGVVFRIQNGEFEMRL